MKRELTKTEKKILRLVGYPRKEIAQKLYISEGTVQVHLANIRRKFGVKSREQSLIIALKYDVIGIKDVDCGFWDNSGVYVEDIQPVDIREL